MDVDRSGFEHPIIIRYLLPPWLFPFIIFSYAGAIICLYQADVYNGVKVTVTIIVSILFALNIIKLYREAKIRMSIVLTKKDEWYVIFDSGKTMKASLNSASILLPDLIFLRLVVSSSRHYNFILTSTTATSDVLRRLRVRLYYPRSRKSVLSDQ